MNTCKIKCISKSKSMKMYEHMINEDIIHEHITHIGYDGTLRGGPIKITLEEAIRRIEDKISRFYVLDEKTQKKIPLEVINENGKKYIRTMPDGDKDNNLLLLPECLS